MMVVGDALLGSGMGTLVLWAAVDQALAGCSPGCSFFYPSWREVALPDEATSHVAVNRIPICSV